MFNVNSVSNTKTAQPIVFGGLFDVSSWHGNEGYTSRFKGDN